MWRMRVGWLVMVWGLIATAACTSSDAIEPVLDGSAVVGTAAEGIAPVDDLSITIADEPSEDRIDPGLIPDLGGYGYECFGQLPFTDLFVLDDRTSLSAGEFEDLQLVAQLGEAEDWVSFPSGLRMHREPLTDAAPISMLVVPADSWQPLTCAPFWISSARSIAFQVVEEPSAGDPAVLAIENCWDPQDVEIGIRVFDGAAVLWLWSREYVDPCKVDGSVTMEVEVPPGLDRIHSGQRWPFAPPLLSAWYEYREAYPDDLEVPARPPIEVGCSTTGNPYDNTITWTGRAYDVTMTVTSSDGEFTDRSPAWGQLDVWEAEASRELWLIRQRLASFGNPADVSVAVPPNAFQEEVGGTADLTVPTGVARSYELVASRGDEVVTVDCGSGTIPTQLPIPDCTVDITNFVPRFPEGLQRAGTFLRDGEPIAVTPVFGAVVDAGALAGETYTYTFRITDRSDRGRPDRTANCGTITIPEREDLVTTLTVGAREFANRPVLPYVYFTIETDGITRDLRMEPQDQMILIVDPPDDVAEIDPFGIHQRLLEAIEQGREVTAVVDRVSGLPTEWSIDGERWELLCFSLDNRPPELRDGPCDPTFDLISTN